jgi:putative transposase
LGGGGWDAARIVVEEIETKMPYDPKIHHRQSIRLRGYDYSQADMHFVTVVTQERAALFGEVADGQMWLNR